MSETTARIAAVFQKRQRWEKILLGGAGAILLLLSLLPVAIRMGTVFWLEDHGVKHAEVENIDLNLFTGTFAVEGLVADDGLKIGRLFIDIDWWPIFSHRLFIRSVELKGVKADIHQRENGIWQLSSIRLDEVPAEQPAGRSEEQSEPWQPVLNHIDVADVKLNAKGAFDGKDFELSLPLDSLNIVLKKAEESGAQLVSSRVRLGKVVFNGFGYLFENSQLAVEQTVFLPAMGSNIAAGLKLQNLKLKMNGLSLLDKQHDVTLAGIDTIDLDQMNLSDVSRATFDLFSLQGVELPAADKQSLGHIDKIDLHQGDLDFSGVYKFKKIAVHGLQTAVKKLENGTTVVLDRLLSKTQTDSGKVTKAEKIVLPKEREQIATAPESPVVKRPVVYIEQFVVEKGSTISYRDESLLPSFDTALQVETVTVAPIDTSGAEPGKVDMVFTLNKNGSLAVSGELALSPDDIKSELNIVLKNFDMPGLTGFVEADFGHAIKTGQFNLNSTIKVARSVIDAKNRLVIRGLTLEKARQPGKAEAGLGMPVDMALDMLRDDRGDISMDVPVTGRLDDPDVNIGDAINKALVTAMSAGAMTYAKLVLQPYGAILMAAEMAVGAAKKASRPKLTPIQFNERSATLTPDMGEYTNKIAILMKQKAFRLQICGVASRIEGGGTTADRPKIMDDEQLLKLAKSRSDAVVQAIQKHGIAAERLFNCRPDIDEKRGKVGPRVELILD